MLGDAEDWADDYGLHFPVLAGDSAALAGEDWSVTALPTYFVLDPNFKILDIVEERFSIQRNGNLAAGVLGTAVIQEKVVEVLDVDTLTVPA